LNSPISCLGFSFDLGGLTFRAPTAFFSVKNQTISSPWPITFANAVLFTDRRPKIARKGCFPPSSQTGPTTQHFPTSRRVPPHTGFFLHETLLPSAYTNPSTNPFPLLFITPFSSAASPLATPPLTYPPFPPPNVPPLFLPSGYAIHVFWRLSFAWTSPCSQVLFPRWCYVVTPVFPPFSVNRRVHLAYSSLLVCGRLFGNIPPSPVPSPRVACVMWLSMRTVFPPKFLLLVFQDPTGVQWCFCGPGLLSFFLPVTTPSNPSFNACLNLCWGGRSKFLPFLFFPSLDFFFFFFIFVALGLFVSVIETSFFTSSTQHCQFGCIHPQTSLPHFVGLGPITPFLLPIFDLYVLYLLSFLSLSFCALRISPPRTILFVGHTLLVFFFDSAGCVDLPPPSFVSSCRLP